MLVLASFPMRPETVIDYLFALGWDLTLPIVPEAYNPYEFELNVAPGFHKYIALFWRKSKGSPYDFKKLADNVWNIVREIHPKWDLNACHSIDPAPITPSMEGK